MASWSRRETVTRHVEYRVPAGPPYGAAWSEVNKAIVAALVEYRRLHRLPEDARPFDDWLWVFPVDDEIVIRFEVKEPSGGFVATATECRQCQQTEAMPNG